MMYVCMYYVFLCVPVCTFRYQSAYTVHIHLLVQFQVCNKNGSLNNISSTGFCYRKPNRSYLVKKKRIPQRVNMEKVRFQE